MKKFTLSEMIQAASISYSEHNNSLLEQASSTRNLKGIEKLIPKAPEEFPKYIPGSSCHQKGQDHSFFKKGNREVCAKCGSSRSALR